jgi:uncharacterized peroxidase-related enzyme
LTIYRQVCILTISIIWMQKNTGEAMNQTTLRLQAISPEEAKGELVEVYQSIQGMLGMVPNLFQTIAIQPKALQTFLRFSGELKKGLLSGGEHESIALTVAEFNQCHYCLAAHTTLGKMRKLSDDEMISNRKGTSLETKKQALVQFVHETLAKKGNVSDETFQYLIDAGYDRAVIPEIFLSITENIFTNYFNNFNGTTIDFPEVKKLS